MADEVRSSDIESVNTNIFKKRMGKKEKADKKPKSNKIEALRKKYEALLQEDKRRKERNEYILEKMDNMRTCKALVPSQHRSFIQGTPSGLLTSSNNLAPRVGVSVSPKTQFHQYRNETEPQLPSNGSAVSLLKDIYSKYILIPKRQPNDEQVNVQNFLESNIDTKVTKPAENNFEINSDWKSKYEILDKIKQDEKECVRNDGPEFDNSIRQQRSLAYPKRYEEEIPEKDNNNTIKLLKDNDGQQLSNAKNATNCSNHKENSTYPDTNPYQFTNIEGSEKIEHLDDEGINPAHISYPPLNIGKPFGDIPNVTEDVHYPIDVINIEEFTPEPNIVVQDGVNINPKEYGLNKDHFKSRSANEGQEKDDIIYDKGKVHVNAEEYDTQKHYQKSQSHEVEDSSETDKIDPTEQPENSQMTLVSGILNDEPQYIQSTTISYESQPVPLTEHTDDLGNSSAQIDGIADTVEQAMYYPEVTTEAAHDPPATADETWENTLQENVQQNDQYYYEGPHETPESIHINEHEETNTQYDQNYVQQYDAASNNQQAYDETQQYNLPQVGYDETAGGEVEHVYDENGQIIYGQTGQAVHDQSGNAVYDDQSGDAIYDQSGDAVYDQSGDAVYDQSEHVAYDQTENVGYNQDEHIAYNQSVHAEYDQNEHAVYAQSEHTGYEQQPKEQYSPEYGEQPYLEENYEQPGHIEEQLDREDGYVVAQNERVEELNVENQQPPIVEP